MYGRYAAGDDDDDYDEDVGASGIQVPTASTRKSKVRDRSGNTTFRETTVLRLRACLHCHLVMTEEQFMESGCSNCPHLQLDNNREAIQVHTTTNFKGLAVILRPEMSWVARHNNLTNGVPGAYAVSTNHSVYSGGY